MKIIIILLICVPSLLAEDNAGDISFKYGFLGQFKSNPDSTVLLSDSSVIHTGDRVRINIGYLKESNFLLIFSTLI